MLTQMRTNKIGLATFLHKIKVTDDPYCDCGTAEQTVSHVLFDCTLFTTIRSEYPELSASSTLKGLLTESKAALAASSFMQRTGLLKQFRYSSFPTV